MTTDIFSLMREARSIGEIMTGAYGYLSASVDSYLNSPGVNQTELAQDFDAIQAEVAAGVGRVLSTSGLEPHEVLAGVAEAAREYGLSEEHVQQVARRALKLVFPTTPVTDS